MSDVLVRGMKMPKNCKECGVCYVDASGQGYCILKDEYSDCESTGLERRFDCPLVEVPQHGRLIDADAFDERVRAAGGMSEEELTEDFKDGVQTVLYMLSKQPTIIEAEGSET